MAGRLTFARISAYGIASLVSLVFLYPFWWMFVSSFRDAEAILTRPLRLLPESFSLKAYGEIARIGGTPLSTFVWNSLFITIISTILAVVIAALGAYALTRRPDLRGFRFIRYGFLLTIMYPYMLLVIPVYIVMYYLGLLGSYTGIILFLSLGPIQFFLFEQFFRTLPKEMIEAALVDGAGELQVLFRIVLPVCWPVVGTVTLITFLLNWSQWFPVLVISRSPSTYTLPTALLMLNSELGVNFQGIMALATLTTLPVVVVFLATQRRVMQGMAAGAVKG
ncbi:MAG: carbohydrate ABC transporter permease [Geminicoccaceae bacterium]